MWPARGKHTPMPPKPWPTNYLLKIRHDLVHSGRLHTCKQQNPQAVIYHTTCTQSISIINYIIIYIILECIQHYRLSTEYLCDIDTTTLYMTRETMQDAPRWQYTDPSPSNDLMSKVNRAHHWTNVSYLRGVVEGPGRSISVKETTKQWVKHSVSKYNIWKT